MPPVLHGFPRDFLRTDGLPAPGSGEKRRMGNSRERNVPGERSGGLARSPGTQVRAVTREQPFLELYSSRTNPVLPLYGPVAVAGADLAEVVDPRHAGLARQIDRGEVGDVELLVPVADADADLRREEVLHVGASGAATCSSRSAAG